MIITMKPPFRTNGWEERLDGWVEESKQNSPI